MTRTHVAILFNCESHVLMMAMRSYRDKACEIHVAKRNCVSTHQTWVVAERGLRDEF